MDYKLLTGRENKELIEWQPGSGLLIHKDMKSSLQELIREGKEKGFSIQVASAYRDYEKQRTIWNAKASGKRKIYNRSEELVDFQNASPKEILEAIMSWSAIPGASRHHWGTEIDIFDESCRSREDLELSVKECSDHFSKMYEWIDSKLSALPFHRPYENDLGGVAREPWHLSFTAKSIEFQNAYNIETFERNILEGDIIFKQEILQDLEPIYNQYIINVTNP